LKKNASDQKIIKSFKAKIQCMFPSPHLSLSFALLSPLSPFSGGADGNRAGSARKTYLIRPQKKKNLISTGYVLSLLLPDIYAPLFVCDSTNFSHAENEMSDQTSKLGRQILWRLCSLYIDLSLFLFSQFI
jgi:hypothetical protein